MRNLSVSAHELLVIYGVLVVFASLMGGWMLLATRMTHARLQVAVSFVAGLMLAMALLHFIPDAFDQLHSLERIAEWVLVGFLAMFFLQRFFPYHHHDMPETSGRGDEAELREAYPHEEVPGHSHHDHLPAGHGGHHLSWVAAMLGMSLHSLVGGVALAAAVAAGERAHGTMLLGLGTALVIILHKPFDAMAVTTLMTTGGHSHSFRHLINALFALVTPLGMVLFYFGVSQAAESNPATLGIALAFCGGTFLCIAAADLLPELQFHTHDRVKLSIALLAGVAIAVLIGVFDTNRHEQHTPSAPNVSAPARP